MPREEMKLTPEQAEQITRVLRAKEATDAAMGKGTRKEEFFLWLFDTGRLGQTLHYLVLAARGPVPLYDDPDIQAEYEMEHPEYKPPTRGSYLRGAWATMRYGPRY